MFIKIHYYNQEEEEDEELFKIENAMTGEMLELFMLHADMYVLIRQIKDGQMMTDINGEEQMKQTMNATISMF